MMVDDGEESQLKGPIDILAPYTSCRYNSQKADSKLCRFPERNWCCRQDWMRTDRHHSPRTVRRVCMLTRSGAG